MSESQSGDKQRDSAQGSTEQESKISRRQALGAGAAVAGGVALGGLVRSGDAGAAVFSPSSTTVVAGQFKAALSKLATNTTFRASAMKDPTLITKSFKLTAGELEMLRQVAILSGADNAALNKARAAAISGRSGITIGNTGIGWSISCCSCCCCCCGETSVLTHAA